LAAALVLLEVAFRRLQIDNRTARRREFNAEPKFDSQIAWHREPRAPISSVLR
jgi:hypothetical protein